MLGQTISQYTILEKLGEGGMGIVYKALDAKLNRTVALKFLPHHLSSTPEEKARFLQEAQAAATLNHPNVCTIYDIKEHDGQQFIVMEYVDGVTLRKMMAAGPISLGKTAGYALQIGDALSEAHQKGIVHRDIKPDNIMVNSKNTVKVMDFGLAKLKGSLKLTRSSSTVGTLAYMAPEQIQGGEVDARSDIFAFGVVLFEMLTGRMPFRGDHEAAMMYSILNEEPENLQKYLPDAPAELLHIFGRALEKNPEDRYQSAHDMVIDLKRLKKETSKVSRASLPDVSAAAASGTAANPADIPAVPPSSALRIGSANRRIILTGVAAGVIALGLMVYFYLLPKAESPKGERLPIAVADFVNQTGEVELDGLSGMLITALEQSRRLSVLTRSRMFDILKSMGNADAEKIDESLGKTICNQANIGALVTASIRKFGKLYSIDLKVLDTRNNEYIFTAKEEAEGQENIPAMLDKLSEKTRIGLKEQAAEVTATNVAQVTTSNMEAYQHFFQGEQYINKLKFEEAKKEFRQAVQLDSTFGLAWYRLAYALAWNPETRTTSTDVMAKAFLYENRLPEKERYLLRAVQSVQKESFAGAVGILKEMEKLYPDDKEMIYNIGDYSFHAGDYATAESYLQKTLKMDPTFERALQHLTWTYREEMKYDEMTEVAKRYVSAAGTSAAYLLLGQALEYSGQFEQGLKTLQTAQEAYPENADIRVECARLYQFLGQSVRGEAELKALLRNEMSPQTQRAGFVGLVSFLNYAGRFREALQTYDMRIELDRKARDSAGIAADYAQKAYTMVVGPHDVEGAWKELQKAAPFRSKGKFPDYWGFAALVTIYHGDYATADTMRVFAGWVGCLLRSVGQSLQKNCERARQLADSAEQTGPSVIRTVVVLPLARCQIEAGRYDEALASLQKLRDLKEANSSVTSVLARYMQGLAYEKKGERALAVQYYEEFLKIWKDADNDSPDLLDAKARLGKLKGSAGT